MASTPGAHRPPRAPAGPEPGAAHPVWLQPAHDGWILSVAAQPGAPRTEAMGVFDGCLKLRVRAAPLDGRANEALIEWLARQLGLPRAAISLTAGERSRRKRLRLRCALDAPTIAARLYQGEAP